MRIRIERDDKGNVRCQGSFLLDGIYVTRQATAPSKTVDAAGRGLDATDALNEMFDTVETAKNWASERREVK